MVARRVWKVMTLALLLGCGPATRERAPTAPDLARLLPAPSSLDGWSAVEGPVTYVPTTLWEYLDGGAPRYLAYGFRMLVHVRYELGGDLLSSITLDVFDMGSDLGAFGIYRSVRPAEAAHREWGVDGHRAGPVAAAWKESIYVHAAANDDLPELNEMLERLVAGVCDQVTGHAALPKILDPLPPAGLVPRSERYLAGDLLGYAFLPGGVLATYDVEGHEAQLFFSDLGSDATAIKAMAELRAHQSQWGEIVREIPSIGGGGFQFSDPGLGSGTVVGTGRYVAGVHGDLPYDAQKRLLGLLVEGLASSASGTPPQS
jgi:hypothetical protein